MRHVDAYPLPECAGDGVGGVDPAVRVEHVLWDVFGVDAVDGVAHVLPSGDDQGEGQQAHDREGVVEPEDGAVDVHVAHLDQVLQAAEDVQHLGGFLTWLLLGEHNVGQSRGSQGRASGWRQGGWEGGKSKISTEDGGERRIGGRGEGGTEQRRTFSSWDGLESPPPPRLSPSSPGKFFGRPSLSLSLSLSPLSPFFSRETLEGDLPSLHLLLFSQAGRQKCDIRREGGAVKKLGQI